MIPQLCTGAMVYRPRRLLNDVQGSHSRRFLLPLAAQNSQRLYSTEETVMADVDPFAHCVDQRFRCPQYQWNSRIRKYFSSHLGAESEMAPT
jgi:hypothetical protein